MEVLFDCIYKKYFTHSTLTITCQLQMQIATKTVPKVSQISTIFQLIWT